MNQDLVEQIESLKKERNAIILAHSYQRDEVQDIADFVGDSLGLSREAAKTDAEVIVFAGVHFMAETAAILNPGKTVLIPDLEAGCSLADTISAADVQAWKDENPDGLVVAYVNTTADVKALADVCVTSANAVSVVTALDPDRPIFFVPDMFLGAHVERETGRKMSLWLGECHVHAGIGEKEINSRLAEHGNAEFLIHPECSCGSACLYLKPDAKIMSTEGMVRFSQSSEADEFVVATEVGILHRLQRFSPEKRFFPVKESAVCEYMKMITLEKILDSLLKNQFKVEIPPDIAEKARRSLESMIAVG
ncbi:MAG: quinolinate synthase NadA [Actinomycetota bacterium]|jgi:quinolinate synthase|nr:quinolinate synthase NadA [Actinomycetota bacterium]